MQDFIEIMNVFQEELSSVLSMANLTLTLVDLVEILIISFLFYHVILWVKSTRAWNLFKGILMTYLKKGGQSIQFNIFNTETLRDAQKNPEKYKNLQVRVCGWNTLWNNMSKKEQDAYILRAENIQ